MDFRPRQFQASQLVLLAHFAELTVREMEQELVSSGTACVGVIQWYAHSAWCVDITAVVAVLAVLCPAPPCLARSHAPSLCAAAPAPTGPVAYFAPCGVALTLWRGTHTVAWRSH